jgi:hypothetical protein
MLQICMLGVHPISNYTRGRKEEELSQQEVTGKTEVGGT